MASRNDASEADDGKRQLGGCSAMRAGALTVCILHTLATSFSRLAVREMSRSPQVRPYSDNLPLELTPGDWSAVGGVVGCTVAFPLLAWCGRKNSLQLVSLPLLLAAYTALYFLPRLDSDHDRFSNTVWVFVFTVCLFFQGVGEMVSEVGVVVYVLETVCDEPWTKESYRAAVLVLATHLPLPASEVGYILMHRLALVRVAPVLGLMAVMFLYTPLPESPAWLLATAREERARAVLHSLRPGGSRGREILQPPTTTNEEGWLRPLLVSCGVLLLSEFTGKDAYRFYSNWAFRFAGVRGGVELGSPCAALAASCLALVVCLAARGPRGPIWLSTVSTGVVTACLFTTGTLLHGLEQGSSPAWWLPACLTVVAEAGTSLGLGSQAVAVAGGVTPPAQRAGVMSAALLLRRAAAHLNPRVLPLLLDSLHPFGVFWLYASLSAVGLLYLAAVVGPELRFASRTRPSSSPPRLGLMRLTPLERPDQP